MSNRVVNFGDIAVVQWLRRNDAISVMFHAFVEFREGAQSRCGTVVLNLANFEKSMELPGDRSQLCPCCYGKIYPWFDVGYGSRGMHAMNNVEGK